MAVLFVLATAGAWGQAVPPPSGQIRAVHADKPEKRASEPAPIAVPPPPMPSPEPPLPERTWFRIGYLRPTPESTLGPRWYQELKTAILKDEAFRRASAEAGVTGVALRPCDGADDMLQRMDQNEFELVFCPAMVHVQSRVLNPGRYRVLFQTRRRGVDQADSRGGGHVRQRGVVFARRGSPLDRPDLAPAALKSLFESRRMAVSGSYDAAGFFYVRKMLLEDYDGTRPGDFMYCGTAEDVVKTVLSGLAEVGACEEGALKRVFDALPDEAGANTEIRDGANRYVRVILYTSWVPTDPVAIREEFDPRYRRSPLGQAAAAVVRRLYNQSEMAPTLENGDDTAYDRMADDVRLTPHLTRGEGW